jgi:hypothetical protein
MFRRSPTIATHPLVKPTEPHKELRIDSRAIFVVDGSDTIRHVEYVKK